MRAELGRQLLRVAAKARARECRLVEGRLELLEAERELHDRQVARGHRCERARHEWGHRARPVRRADRQRAAQDERRAGVAVCLDLVVRAHWVTRYGLIESSTVAAVVGTANAPFGVGLTFAATDSAAAWRPSTLWIDSAPASRSLLTMRSACPRKAPAPRFSKVTASFRISSWFGRLKVVFGGAGGLPPLSFTNASSACACWRSWSPKRFAISSSGPLSLPLATAFA